MLEVKKVEGRQWKIDQSDQKRCVGSEWSVMHGPLLQSGQTCTTLVVFHYDANHMSTGPSLGSAQNYAYFPYICVCMYMYIYFCPVARRK